MFKHGLRHELRPAELLLEIPFTIPTFILANPHTALASDHLVQGSQKLCLHPRHAGISNILGDESNAAVLIPVGFDQKQGHVCPRSGATVPMIGHPWLDLQVLPLRLLGHHPPDACLCGVDEELLRNTKIKKHIMVSVKLFMFAK